MLKYSAAHVVSGAGARCGDAELDEIGSVDDGGGNLRPFHILAAQALHTVDQGGAGKQLGKLVGR